MAETTEIKIIPIDDITGTAPSGFQSSKNREIQALQIPTPPPDEGLPPTAQAKDIVLEQEVTEYPDSEAEASADSIRQDRVSKMIDMVRSGAETNPTLQEEKLLELYTEYLEAGGTVQDLQAMTGEVGSESPEMQQVLELADKEKGFLINELIELRLGEDDRSKARAAQLISELQSLGGEIDDIRPAFRAMSEEDKADFFTLIRETNKDLITARNLLDSLEQENGESQALSKIETPLDSILSMELTEELKEELQEAGIDADEEDQLKVPKWAVLGLVVLGVMGGRDASRAVGVILACALGEDAKDHLQKLGIADTRDSWQNKTIDKLLPVLTEEQLSRAIIDFSEDELIDFLESIDDRELQRMLAGQNYGGILKTRKFNQAQLQDIREKITKTGRERALRVLKNKGITLTQEEAATDATA